LKLKKILTTLKRFSLAFFSCISYFGFIFKGMNFPRFFGAGGWQSAANCIPDERVRICANQTANMEPGGKT